MSSKSMSTIFSEWANTQSCPAISNASQANGKINRIFWIFTFIFGTAFTLFFVYSTIHSYLQYPIKIIIRNEQKNSIPFPSVSFCNLNKFKVDEIDNFPEGTKEIWNKTFYNLRNALSYSEKKDLLNMLNWDYSYLDESTRIEKGHKLEDVMLDCYINDNKCDRKDFVLINNWIYGNCFRFNSDIKAVDSGSLSNIALNLFTEQDKYVTEGTGFALVIHDKNVKPEFTKPFLIQPSLETHIGLRKKIIRRLPHPYQTNCTLDGNLHECQDKNIQQENIDICKCYDNTIPFNNVTNPNIKACGHDETKCQNELIRDIRNREEGYDCNFPCEETQFTFTKTSIKWPNSNILSIYKKMLNVKYNESFKDVSDHHLSSQLAKVVIYFNYMDVEIIEEKPLLTPTDLFSNIGGSMGLILGFSICSLFEYLPLIPRIILNLKGKLMKKTFYITK